MRARLRTHTRFLLRPPVLPLIAAPDCTNYASTPPDGLRLGRLSAPEAEPALPGGAVRVEIPIREYPKCRRCQYDRTGVRLD